MTRISRRAVVTSTALLSASAALAAGMPAAAAAAVKADDPALRSFEARYAIHGGSIIEGYFTAPRAPDTLDVVVMLPGDAGITPDLKAAARRQATGGAMVIVPDLAASASASARRAGRDAMVAEIMAQVPNLRHLSRGTGRVRVIAAA